jgi:hypothetical protein
MPNPYLSGRIPVELDKQVDEFLARTGETKTQMLIKAVSAYIGAEAPPFKPTGDRRMENVEQKVAELEGANKSLYEKIAALTTKIENLKVQFESIIAYENSGDNNDSNTDNSDPIEDIDKVNYISSDIDENAIDSSDNYVENEKVNTPDNTNDNDDNALKTIDIKLTIDEDKTFLNIETAEVARRTKLEPKTINNLWTSFKRKSKRENQNLSQKKILDSPIKMTPSSEVKIEKVPYDIFYVGQSEEGRNLWNLVPITTVGEDVPLPFDVDNN